jgi:hypothetical protein
LRAAAPTLQLGPYTLHERIGEGGSGQVYRASGPGGPVAVKILGPASDLDDAARARFLREIAALGQLSHPSLVPLIDHGIDAELGPYLVMPVLPGSNLRALCAGQALCPEVALLVMSPVIHAAAALHAAGYVHRDLKPENVIAAPDGVITVIDLGLAWRDGMTRHTDTGAAVGSVGYMAPEQIEGRPVSASADVWALGAMVYEVVAGKRPFSRARPSEEAAAALLGTCARLSAADRRSGEELASVLAPCFALDPAQRPSAAALAAALDALIDWTDDFAGERAAAVADPAGYQARVAPFRVRRAERSAREAIAAGKPFAALAACDRGLAYAPDHASLLGIVAEAEAATAKRAPVSAAAEIAFAKTAISPAKVDSDKHPAASASITVKSSPRAARLRWIAIGALGIALGSLITYKVIPDHREPAPPPAAAVAPDDVAPPQQENTSGDPWGGPTRNHDGTARQRKEHDENMALARDFLSLFGRAIETMPNKDAGVTAPADHPSP